MVYDVTDRASFAKLDDWLDELSMHGGKPLVTVVAANKVDDTTNRKVSESEGRRWAETKKIAYFETSAKTGQEVNNVFSAILHGVVTKLQQIAKDIS